MRGLYASIQIPSPLAANGGGQAAFEYARSLAAHADLDVVTFVDPGLEPWLEPMREFVDEVIAVPWKPSYAVRLGRWAASAVKSGEWAPFLNRPYLDALHRRIADHRYDFVQVDWTEVAMHARIPPAIPFLCGAHDVRTRLAQREASKTGAGHEVRRHLERTRREETRLFERADAVLTLSEADARFVRALVPGTRVFPLVYRRAVIADDSTAVAREPATVLYVGDFSRDANATVARSLLRELMPRIREQVPTACLVLAGGGVDGALTRLAEQYGAELTGYVEDLGEVYRRATVLLAPIPLGGGVHIKMIEAMSTGLPVLTTTAGNDGIAADPDVSVILADTPEGQVAGAVRLLENPTKATEVGRAGRDHVHEHFGEERATERLGDLLDWLASRRARGG